MDRPRSKFAPPRSRLIRILPLLGLPALLGIGPAAPTRAEGPGAGSTGSTAGGARSDTAAPRPAYPPVSPARAPGSSPADQAASARETARRDSCLATVTAFYKWVLRNGASTDSLCPAIAEIEGTTRFYVDLGTLPRFTSRFMQSGLFAHSFPERVEAYFRRYQQKFLTIPQEDFDQIALDGRGPMMEVEDMDLFFCAQEYDYTEAFVAKLKPVAFHAGDGSAEMTVESPYGWKTEFDFAREAGRWLISGYCVFR
jgi:hypothetical protein